MSYRQVPVQGSSPVTPRFGSAFATIALGLSSLIVFSASGQSGFPEIIVIENNGTLYDLDFDQEEFFAVNPRVTGLSGVVGIEFGARGQLFALTHLNGLPQPNALYSIDPLTGASKLIGSTSLKVFEGDLAYDKSTNTLYGLTDIPTPAVNRNLFRIDQETGNGVVVINLTPQAGDLSAMSFVCDSFVQIINTNSELLLTVDLNSGVDDIISLSTPLGAIAAMDFDEHSAAMFVADGGTAGTNRVYTLNLDTGQLTLLGQSGIKEGMSGLAIVPTVSPCPADLDENGSIGLRDLLQLLSSWGPCQCCAADLDGDAVVGIADLLELLTQWGPCR